MVEEEIVVEPLTASDLLAQQEGLTFKDRQEGIVGTLADPDEVKRFTNLRKRDPVLFAKILYIHEDIKAMEKWENDQINGGPTKEGEVWMGGDYIPPEMPKALVLPDWHLRTSEQNLLIKVFKSISHLVEGGSGGRSGFFGRHKP